jgi:hypothetical protein
MNSNAENLSSRRVSKIRLDLTEQYYEKQLDPNIAHFPHFGVTLREEYWGTLLPTEAGMTVGDILPSATRLTLHFGCQNLELVCGARAVGVLARGIQVLGTRLRRLCWRVKWARTER